MIVKEIMATALCSVDQESTLAVAATLMAEQAVGSVLVLEGETILGIVTERDIVKALSNAHDAPVRPVIEWMTRNPTTIAPSATVREALRVMMEGGFRHLPVVDDGRAAGMISMRDIARGLSDT